MWRFFRLGIKSNNCVGNLSSFRLVSTTCSSNEGEEQTEPEDLDCCILPEATKYNLAANAAHKYHKFLLSKENLLQPQKVLKCDIKFKSAVPLFKDHPTSFTFKNKNFNELKPNKNLNSNNLKSVKHLNEESELDNPEYEFGNLCKVKEKHNLLQEEEKESLQVKNYEKYDQRLSPQSYGKKMLNLCKEKKIKEALKVLEVEMKAQRVVPDVYCYNILINACGKVGYSRKSFELYYQMKQRGLIPQKFAYTGLFNACANSPNAGEEELKSASLLRKELTDKKILIHPITYHAMIKAFGRCKDIKTAFEIADEMIKRKHIVTTETMNFLLQACISDKENGFRHSLMVWHKMRRLKISPNIFSYNLLLRCVKECQAGDPQLVNQILEVRNPNNNNSNSQKGIQSKNQTPKKLQGEINIEKNKDGKTTNIGESQSSNDSVHEDSISSMKSVYQVKENNEIVSVDLSENMEMEIYQQVLLPSEEPVLPNILAKHFQPHKVTGIASLEKSEDRLLFLGGTIGILRNMADDRVKPTNATFTYILESLPQVKDLEDTLLSAMEKCEVVPDVIFCNKLIHKRCKRGKLEEAKEVMELMQKHHITPDTVTFSCLAINCEKPSTIRTLLKDMAKMDITPTIQLMTSLITNSLRSHKYEFTVELLKYCKALEIIPDERMLEGLELARTKIRNNIIKQERGEVNFSSHKVDEMKLFLMEYKYWLKGSKVDLKDHPWAQYGYKTHNNVVENL